MNNPKCKDCRYWKYRFSNSIQVKIGECRRRAPVYNTEDSGWPTTCEDEVCGEFEEMKELHEEK